VTWVALYLTVSGLVVLDHYLGVRRAMNAGRVEAPRAEIR
jgi:hypothetical protein